MVLEDQKLVCGGHKMETTTKIGRRVRQHIALILLQ